MVNYDIVCESRSRYLYYFLDFVLLVQIALLLLNTVAKVIGPFFKLKLGGCLA
jgi:hypothetical protein